MTKIITAINNPELNKELKRENNIELMCKDIQYKEGILEMLEENVTVDYIIIDEKLPGEINIEELIEKIIEINEKIKIIIAIKKENKKNNNYNNKNIITIIYENKINLNKLKNYKKDTKEINVKKIKKEKNKDYIIGFAFILCGLSKFLLEYLRASHINIFLSCNQIVSLIFVGVGVCFILKKIVIKLKF